MHPYTLCFFDFFKLKETIVNRWIWIQAANKAKLKLPTDRRIPYCKIPNLIKSAKTKCRCSPGECAHTRVREIEKGRESKSMGGTYLKQGGSQLELFSDRKVSSTIHENRRRLPPHRNYNAVPETLPFREKTIRCPDFSLSLSLNRTAHRIAK